MIGLRYRVAEPLLPEVKNRWGDVRNGTRSHPHPVLANERLLVRENILRLAEQQANLPNKNAAYAMPATFADNVKAAILGDEDTQFNNCFVNVGGRPLLNGSALVRSCCPVVGPGDVPRHANYRRYVEAMLDRFAHAVVGDKGTIDQWDKYFKWSDGIASNPDRWMCAHRFAECDCYPGVKCFISIHSLYYLDPKDIFAVLQRYPGVPFIAALHRFPDPVGQLGLGEARYSWNPNGNQITMSVEGNLESYVHSDMKWLWGSGLAMGMQGTLCWSQIDRIGETDFVMFTASSLNVPMPIKVAPNLLEGLQDRKYIGVLSFSTVRDKPIMLPDLGDFEIREAVVNNAFSYMNWIVVGGTSTVMLSKSLVWDLAQRCVGKERDADLVKTLTLHARAMVRKLALTEQQRYENVVYGSYLAMHVGAMMELNAIASHESQSALWKPLNAYYRGSAWVISPTMSKILLGIGALATVAAPVSFKQKVIGLSVITGLACLVHRKPPSPGALTRAQTTVTNVCCEGIPVKPQQIGSKVTVTDDVECKVGFGAKLLAFGLPGVKPTVVRSCVHNDYLAIRNRMSLENRKVMFMPDGQVKTEDPDWRLVHSLFSDLNCLHLKSKIKTDVRAYPFEGWLADLSVSGSRKEMLRRMHATLKHKSFGTIFAVSKDWSRASFTKIEKLLGSIGPSPRLIQGAQPAYQVLTGPITKSLSTRTKDTWTRSNVIYYTAGARPSDLGWFVDQIQDLAPVEGGYVLGEVDFSTYDGTQSLGSLTMEVIVYRTAGIADKYVVAIKMQWVSNGQTHNEVVYLVYYKRNSGDGNTSVGNSITNGTACSAAVLKNRMAPHILQRMGFEMKRVRIIPGDDDLPPLEDFEFDYEDIMKKHCRFMVMGDDNLMIIPKQLVQETYFAEFLTELGLTPQFKFSEDIADVEFCSGRFYPSDRGTIWGPKIGRILGKTGWALKPYGKRRSLQWLKGVALGMRIDTAHIPVVRRVVEVMLRVAGSVKPLSDVELKKYRMYEHETVAANATEDTISFVCRVYDCTPEELRALEDEISGVNSLPYIIKHPLAMRMLTKDVKIKTDEHNVVEGSGPQIIPGSYASGTVLEFIGWCMGKAKNLIPSLSHAVGRLGERLHTSIMVLMQAYAAPQVWLINALQRLWVSKLDGVYLPLIEDGTCKSEDYETFKAILVRFFSILVWAPITEELVKKFTSVKDLPVSVACIGIVVMEWTVDITQAGHDWAYYVPTALMHVLCDRLPYPKAVALHAFWNLAAMIAGSNLAAGSTVIAEPTFRALVGKEGLRANFHFSHICLVISFTLKVVSLVRMVKSKKNGAASNKPRAGQNQAQKKKDSRPRTQVALRSNFARGFLTPFDVRSSRVPDGTLVRTNTGYVRCAVNGGQPMFNFGSTSRYCYVAADPFIADAAKPMWFGSSGASGSTSWFNFGTNPTTLDFISDKVFALSYNSDFSSGGTTSSSRVTGGGVSVKFFGVGPTTPVDLYYIPMFNGSSFPSTFQSTAGNCVKHWNITGDSQVQVPWAIRSAQNCFEWVGKGKNGAAYLDFPSDDGITSSTMLRTNFGTTASTDLTSQNQAITAHSLQGGMGGAFLAFRLPPGAGVVVESLALYEYIDQGATPDAFSSDSTTMMELSCAAEVEAVCNAVSAVTSVPNSKVVNRDVCPWDDLQHLAGNASAQVIQGMNEAITDTGILNKLAYGATVGGIGVGAGIAVHQARNRGAITQG